MGLKINGIETHLAANMRALFVIFLLIISDNACCANSAPGSLCRYQDLKILRHLSLHEREKKQYKALLDLLARQDKIGKTDQTILRAFADCWGKFKQQSIGEGFAGYAANWNSIDGKLVFETPSERFEFRDESVRKLPSRINRMIKDISGYPDAIALHDVLWFLWTEAAIASLGHRHNIYVYAEELDWHTAMSSGRIFTPGFSPRYSNGLTYVDRIIDEKLEQAGIHPGMQVVAIDSRYVEILNDSEWWVQQRPFKYSLVVKDAEGIKSGEFASIPRFSSNVQLRMLDDIAYIRIEYFDIRTGVVLSRLFRDFDDGINGVILDLRDNPGGIVTPLAVDYFLKPAQTVLVVKQADQKQVSYKGTIAYIPQPLVILQNRYSASMAEIVSAMLHSQHRAYIVGETSFGKSVGQKTYMIGREGMAMLVDTQYYYPDGITHWGEVGVKPDFEVSVSGNQQRQISELLYTDAIDVKALSKIDPYLIRAISVLEDKHE